MSESFKAVLLNPEGGMWAVPSRLALSNQFLTLVTPRMRTVLELVYFVSDMNNMNNVTNLNASFHATVNVRRRRQNTNITIRIVN